MKTLPLRMEKSIVYRRCEKLMDALKEAGYEENVSYNDLVMMISRNVGGNRETIRSYLKHLHRFGMIYPTVNPNLFRIDHDYRRKEIQVMKVLGQRTLKP